MANKEPDPHTPANWVRRIAFNLYFFWFFYIHYALTVPILVGLWCARAAHVRWLVVLPVIGYIASLSYTFFLMHYFAAYAGVVVLLAILGFRTMWNWRPRGTPAGAIVASFLFLCACLMAGRIVVLRNLLGLSVAPRTEVWARQTVERSLVDIPGQQLVFVKYSEKHNPHEEWVYNGADLGSSKIIWALALGPESDRELVSHYRPRHAWIVDADAPRPEPQTYRPETILLATRPLSISNASVSTTGERSRVRAH